MDNVGDILKMNLGDIEDPKALPEGTYKGIVTGFTTGKSQQKGTPFVEVNFRLLEAGDDIDEIELQGFGGVEALQKEQLGQTFWLTSKAAYRLRDFLVNVCGQEPGQPAELALANIMNTPVMIKVKINRPDPVGAPEKFYTEVADTFAV